ncbi:hypothetical protein [Nocardioides aurantiacus]|uniref:Uncharacterized protein n=1 Tax=Nocardioides aurantiacus TaxID=86796 RepID=A0A3N2CU38_9ACTN|nr:hypothetical protein [Nocardioides aurantiacus]ROR91052.1 hypothetical protein EDD33_1912 [Nocardioides aurantiacus]
MREHAREDVYFVAVVTVLALAVSTPFIFFWTYAFNDFPTSADHLSFLSRTVVVAVAVGALSGFGVHTFRPMRLHSAVLGAISVSATVLLVAGTGYAFLSMFPALDPAVGSTASDLLCANYAVLLASGAFACGRGAGAQSVLQASEHQGR